MQIPCQLFLKHILIGVAGITNQSDLSYFVHGKVLLRISQNQTLLLKKNCSYNDNNQLQSSLKYNGNVTLVDINLSESSIPFLETFKNSFAIINQLT